MSLIAELKRRNVIKVSLAYLALMWVVIEVTTTIVPVLNLPAWLPVVVVWICLIGLPFVVVFSWIYELTPEGLKRDGVRGQPAAAAGHRTRRLDALIVVLIVVAIALLVFDRVLAPTGRPGPGAVEEGAQAAALDERPVIAVLPFDNYSPNADDAYFAAGVTEEITSQLSRIGDLVVLSRVAVERAMQSEDSLEGVARRLRAGSVLEGSVRMAGDRVRITAQLIDMSDGRHLWSESYDRELDDIFRIQTDVALAIGQALQAQLTSSERSRIEKPLTDNLKAYQLYLKQVGLLGNIPGQNAEGIRLLEEAMALDPDFAAALARLSWRHSWNHSLTGDKDEAGTALTLARKAVEMDPELANAWYALGIANSSHNRADETGRALNRALELDPNYRGALTDGSYYNTFQGSLVIALEQAFRAVQLNPNGAIERWHALMPLLVLGDEARVAAWLGLAEAEGMELARLEMGRAQLAMLRGDREAAVEQLQFVLERYGDEPEPRDWSRALLVTLGAWKEVSDGIRAMGQERPEVISALLLPRMNRTNMAFVLAEQGEAEKAQRAFEESLATGLELTAEPGGFTWPWLDMASIHAYRGDHDRAVADLERAVEKGFLVDFMLRMDPMFASLRGDPRFQGLLERIAARKRQLQAEAEETGALAPYDRMIAAGPAR